VFDSDRSKVLYLIHIQCTHVKMAWNYECVSYKSSNHGANTTPSAPFSSASVDEEHASHCADDSGYFTEFKPALSKPSFAEHCADFPQLNFDISEDKSGPAFDHVHAQQNAHAFPSDSSIDYVNQTLENTDCECRLRLSDMTGTYTPPDDVGRSLHHPSRGSMHEERSAASHQPLHSSSSLCVDFISQLSCVPHVVAVILHYVSDGDLCR